ncbi:cytochrome C biogenesis protein ccsA, putative [Medicago truncatula]|uniref:Cytochrome C biogenesis protein ccsA, putative n=2 Tax=Medicago truncatula TaxID=3880 RepID=G7IWC3_MEDTR|nr:cytochrome C biogenesis protein ccsA, putative [Medicago truncatula]
MRRPKRKSKVRPGQTLEVYQNILSTRWKNLLKHPFARSFRSSLVNTLKDFKKSLHEFCEIEEEEEDGKEDRLSDLPDSIQTCILSKRWKNLWKRLPTLTLISSQFKTLTNFDKFVSQVLSLRDRSNSLYALNFQRKGIMAPYLLKRIFNYAVSHNVQRLQIDVNSDIKSFSSCFFSCHTLTSLNLYVAHPRTSKKIFFPDYLNLPALTRLHLGDVAFRGGAEPFSAYPRLNSLMISNFEIIGEQNLYISSTTLVKLKIQVYYEPKKNYCKIELSTPGLCTFSFVGTPFEILSGNNPSSVKHVKIYANMWWNYVTAPSILLSWLQELADTKTLTVSSNTLQVLSLVPGLLKVKLHSLRNLKSLRVKMSRLSCGLSKSLIDAKLAQLPAGSQEEAAKLREAFKEGSSSIPDGIVYFLLQNSPSAKVHIIN